MSIQEGTIHYLSPQGNTEVRVTPESTNLKIAEPYLDYNPSYAEQCWQICGDPSHTKLSCTLNGEANYLFASDPDAGTAVQTTSEESEAAHWSIVQKAQGEFGPVLEIELLDADGNGTDLFLLGNEQLELNQVYLGAQSDELNWLMDTAALADWWNTAVLLQSQEDSTVLCASSQPGDVVLEPATSFNSLQVVLIEGEAENGKVENAPIMIGNYQLLGNGSGEPVTCGPDGNGHSWSVTDDGYGNITIQCTDENGNNIGWLENNFDQLALNGEKTEKTTQKWKFKKSTTGLTER